MNTTTASATDITFVANPAGNGFIPVFDGHALVKAPSLKGRDILGGAGSFATLTTENERAQDKAAKRLRSGRWTPAVRLTKAGNLPAAAVKRGGATAAQVKAAGKAREERQAALQADNEAKATANAPAPVQAAKPAQPAEPVDDSLAAKVAGIKAAVAAGLISPEQASAAALALFAA